jgi:hypothetical protein
LKQGLIVVFFPGKAVESQIFIYSRDQSVLGCPPSSSQFGGLQLDNSSQAVDYAIFFLMGKTNLYIKLLFVKRKQYLQNLF